MTQIARDIWFFVGTYTDGDSRGIYRCRLNVATGELTLLGLAAEWEDPSYLALHPSNRMLYAVNERRAGGEGEVIAFAIDPQTAELRLVNSQPSAGALPCFVHVDETGDWLVLANYGSGSVALYPLEEGRLGSLACLVQHEGKTGPVRERQDRSHAHCIVPLSGSDRYFSADLGLDRICHYQLDRVAGELRRAEPSTIATAPGSGPRHLAVHSNRRFLYAINELDSTVLLFTLEQGDRAGSIKLLHRQTLSTLPPDFEGNSTTAAVRVAPSGRFLYGSNRGHDSIFVGAIDRTHGTLTTVGYFPTGGQTPRDFAIDPTNSFLLAANQESDSLVLFQMERDGSLTPTGNALTIPSPVCVLFLTS